MFITPAPPGLTAREAALRLSGRPGLAWLDGGLVHGREGRFSFVGAEPVEVCERWGSESCAEGLRELGRPRSETQTPAELSEADVPRWIGALAYEALCPGERKERGLYFARYAALYAFDHETQRAHLVGDDEEAVSRLADMLACPTPVPGDFSVGLLEVTDREAHKRAIAAALGHIHEGDIYQINLARRFQATFDGSALTLFLRMGEQSPVPLGMYLEAGEQTLLGRSMERFLRFRRSDGALWTSPIKGTVKRSADDLRDAAELRGDPKEHAEHAMIVDLMRNDLGRVAHYGSVQIDELLAVLPFAGLSHLVSTISARVPSALPLDTLLHATFPPGSVTGTPKERAVQIIAELEPFERGLYTGAYGFIDRAGGLSLAVTIRSAVVEHAARQVRYYAGGGIVEASDPERETAETELKARVFLDALRAED